MFHVHPQFGALCSQWYDEEIAWLYGQRVSNVNGYKHMMLACPVYGPRFAEMFCSYCIPSIVAHKNALALKSRCTVVVFTDKPTFRLIMSGCHALKKYGIEFIPRIIPDYVMKEINSDLMNRMWVLGLVHSIAMQMCVRWGMGFSMTVPDVTYSRDYFYNMYELQCRHDVILQSTITADLDGLYRGLDQKYRMDSGAISIDAKDLGMLGYKHLHKQNQQYLCNTASFPDRIPYTQFQMWRMSDHIQIYTGFSNPVWLSHEQCMKVASSSLSTLDTRIPQLRITDWYVPSIEDDMCLVDVSTDEKAANAPMANRDDWIDGAWERLSYDPKFMPYRKRAHTVYIGDHGNGYVAQSYVNMIQDKIDELLLAERANAMFRRINGKIIVPALAPWPIHVLP